MRGSHRRCSSREAARRPREGRRSHRSIDLHRSCRFQGDSIMKWTSRWVVGSAVGVVVLVVGLLAARAWVVPAVIVGRLRAQFHGPARFESYWLGRSSAGVTGLALGEPDDIWLSAARVET